MTEKKDGPAADGRSDSGSVTVYLAVTFVFILALLGTLIDGARIVDANAQVYHAAELSSASMLAKFNKELKNRYGLMAYTGDLSETVQQVAEKNLTITGGNISDIVGKKGKPFDLLQLRDISTKATDNTLTLSNPNEFERQVFEYVKYRGVLEFINLDIDFEELTLLDGETEKAENELYVDEAMMNLQDQLADYLEALSKYNEEYTENVSESMIKHIENLSLDIIESANEMEKRFSPGFFDSKPISNEMYDTYMADIRNIKQWGAPRLNDSGAGMEENNQDIGKIVDGYNEAVEGLNNERRNYTKAIPESFVFSAEDVGKLSIISKIDINSDSLLSDVKKGRKENRNGLSGILKPIEKFGLTTLDNAMLSTYAIGNFENTLCFNRIDNVKTKKYLYNMRNDAKMGFFDDCDVEYIIKGRAGEQENFKGIYNDLFLLYMPFNYAKARSIGEIKSVVEAISHSAELSATAASMGNAGIGKIVYYATRESLYTAIAGLQTVHDIDMLYEGERVPLLKNKFIHFAGSVGKVGVWAGVVPTEESLKGGLRMSYVDYLTLRISMMNNNTLVKRLQNLVEINMNATGGTLPAKKSFELSGAKASANVSVKATAPFWFINVLFLTESYDGVGMVLEKRVSQKY